MILKEISELLCIDETDSLHLFEKNALFLSFPWNFIVPEDFNSYIYTSEQLAQYLCKYKDVAVPSKFVRKLNLHETHYIKLSNSEELEVTLFSDEKITGCLCYHFKNKNENTALYLGHFRNISILETDQLFKNLVKKGINYLYLDNTRIGSCYYSYHTMIDTIREIKGIFLEYPNYKICMGLPIFGYEELVEELLKIYKISMNRKLQKLYKTYYPNVKFHDMKNSDIILCEDSGTVEQLKERFQERKVITIRLFEKCKYKLDEMNTVLGIKMLFCSPHMKTCDLRLIIELTQPFNIKEIYSKDDKIPKFLKQASLSWVAENNEFKEKYVPGISIDNGSSYVNNNILNADTEIFDLNQHNSFRSSRSSTEILDNEVTALRNLNILNFDGRNSISNLFSESNLLLRRKKNIKKKNVRPILNENEVKLERNSYSEEASFNLMNVDTFNELWSRNTEYYPHSPSRQNDDFENTTNSKIILSPTKRKIAELFQKNYELQMAKRQEILNNRYRKPIENATTSIAGNDINEKLKLRRLNPEIDSNCNEIKDNTNIITTKLKKINSETNQNILNTQNTVQSVNEPLDLELLNNAEVKLERNSYSEESSFNRIFVDSPSRQNDGHFENTTNSDIILSPTKRKIAELFQKNYELQMAKRQEILENRYRKPIENATTSIAGSDIKFTKVNNETKQNILNTQNTVQSVNEPLDLELLNNAVVDSDYADKIVTMNKKSGKNKNKQIGKSEKKRNNNKNQNITETERLDSCNEPLDLELLNNADIDSDCADEIVKQNINITETEGFDNANAPLDLELLNNAEIDSDCIQSESIIVIDDDKINTRRRNPFHIVNSGVKKITLNSPKAITYLDE